MSSVCLHCGSRRNKDSITEGSTQFHPGIAWSENGFVCRSKDCYRRPLSVIVTAKKPGSNGQRHPFSYITIENGAIKRLLMYLIMSPSLAHFSIERIELT